MGRRKSELEALDHLARTVWGEQGYRRLQQRRAARAARRARVRDITAIAFGVPLIAAAGALVLLPATAYAHTSAIDISCTQVDFHYQSFSDASTTAHEVISVDRSTVVERDFTVTGADGTDAVAISVGVGTHVVAANDSWTSTDGGGTAQAQQALSECNSGETTTVPESTSVPTSSTVSSSTVVSTTVAPTTTVPGSTSTTLPESTSSTIHSTTSTATTPVTGLGSTVPTTSPLQSSTTTVAAPTTNGAQNNPLPFTGSSRTPPAVALGLVGSGLVAIGIGGRRRR